MKRITITLLDSFGIGSAKDADKFGDAGSDTLGHIAQWCSEHRKDSNGTPLPLNLPNLNQLGLGHAAKSSTGHYPLGLDETISPIALYGYAQEISSGKDTPSGHWEIAGAPVLYDWGYFPEMNNSFPQELLQKIYEQNNLTASLANSHASGTAVLDELGEQHMQSGHPIFYTSVDSVFQIACHEETFGLEKLYALCESVREILTKDGYNIGRVIARPFIGDSATGFVRTGNRKDYAVEPPHMTVLEKLVREKNGDVISIGKIADIYAHVGITQKFKATGIPDLFDQTLKIMNEFKTDDTIIFTNFVNFDSDFGHRRDPAGYAEALEYFDSRLPEILSRLSEDELLIITADHGCDPTWHGGDHTREHIPVIVYSPSIKGRDIGGRKTFADIGQTIADYFELSKMDYGQSFLK